MKKLLLFSAIAFLFTGCTKEIEKPTVGFEPDELTFTADGGTLSLKIITSGEWSVDPGSAGWLTFVPASGSGDATVEVTAAAYADATDRTASVKVVSVNEGGSAEGSLTVIQSRKTPPVQPQVREITVRARGGEVTLDAPQGYSYVVAVPSAIDWITVGEQGQDTFVLVFRENASEEDRTASVQLVNSEGETLMTLDITQSWRNVFPGEFLIEELFYTSNIVEETGSPDRYHGDQYIKITNNTDELLYADGLMVMEAKINSAQDVTYIPDVRPESCGVQAIYVVPGNGTDVPVEPHGSLLIVNNAQNHKATNPNSFDLTGADFEWYDESTNSAYLDVDNPDVPNMDKWFCYTMTVWSMHDRGFCGYCIAMPPAGTEMNTYLENYRWEGQYILQTAAGDFTMDVTNAYLVPNSWVLDAVNLSVEEVFYTLSFDTSLDAGYTYCGTTNLDPGRYGKAVIRKKDGNGYLVDTNNSASDFTPNTTPSLAE